MYRTIIVPIDPDGFAEQAVEPALALADAWGARVIAVGEAAAVACRMPTLRARCGRPVGQRHLAHREDPAEAVATVARAEPEPLVVMATHARGRVGYALAGSVSEDMLRTRSAPVLLVGPGNDPCWRPGAGPVVVPLDGDEPSEQAISLACGWSDHFGVPLALIHVDRAPVVVGGNRTPEGIVGLPGTELAPSAATLTRPATVAEPGPDAAGPGETYVTGQANLLRTQGYHADWAARTGRPASVISEYLADNDANLAVLTSYGRAGLGRILGGSTVMAVTHDAPCPVLVHAADQARQEA